MDQSIILMVKMFNNRCNNKGVKNTLVNYIWRKDNVLNKGGEII